MFFYVYILKSKENGRLYIGSTDNLKKRLEKHNTRQVESTKPYVPYDLVYFEGYLFMDTARSREYKLKQFGQAYRRLKERLGLVN